MALARQLILRACDNRKLAPDLARRRDWSRTLALAARGRPWAAAVRVGTGGRRLGGPVDREPMATKLRAVEGQWAWRSHQGAGQKSHS